MTTAVEDPVRRFFGILLEGRTYVKLAYLALAFPLGIAYLVALTVGFSVGIGLSVLLVGIPIVLLTMGFAGVMLGVEGRLTDAAADVEVPRLRRPEPRALVTHHAAVGVVALLGKTAFGIVVLAAGAALFGTGVALLAAPLTVVGVVAGGVHVGPWTVSTLPGALLASLLGVVVTVAALHCCSWLVDGYGRAFAALVEESGVADSASGGREEPDGPRSEGF